MRSVLIALTYRCLALSSNSLSSGRMQGLVFLGDRRVAVQDFPDPVPGHGDVVVAIRASGMCGSDLPGYVGANTDTPAERVIKGHEPCGVVAERGPGVTESQAPI